MISRWPGGYCAVDMIITCNSCCMMIASPSYCSIIPFQDPMEQQPYKKDRRWQLIKSWALLAMTLLVERHLIICCLQRHSKIAEAASLEPERAALHNGWLLTGGHKMVYQCTNGSVRARPTEIRLWLSFQKIVAYNIIEFKHYKFETI